MQVDTGATVAMEIDDAAAFVVQPDFKPLTAEEMAVRSPFHSSRLIS
jgi:hypothetical protein